MSIAYQRHHRQRLKKNRRFHWGRDLIDNPKLLSMAVITPCSCSCWICGNKRKQCPETMQERRARYQERDQ